MATSAASAEKQTTTTTPSSAKTAESSPADINRNDSYNASIDGSGSSSPSKPQSLPWRAYNKIYAIVSWTPPRCRWDPNNPPKFSMSMNVMFGFAGAFTVANLYYSHPILNILAHDFGVPFEKVSQIPTLTQAGYAVGLLFLCPLGDLVKRRPFVLWLVWFAATMSIGLCVTKSFAVFSGLSFIVGLATVTPQVMMPLVGELAPPAKRAAALSIVTSGLMLGILIARLLSGVMTNYVSWRYVYWLSFGLQYIILILLWLFMPDYPSTNPGGMNYFKVLWSIVQLCYKHPVLVQACLISFMTAATFTNYWTTVTFLLAGPPYYYDSLIIGLFALIGIASMFCGPVWARIVIDRFVPLFSVILGELWCMLGICLGTYLGTFTVAGPILQAFINDFGMQTAQIANRSSIYSIAPLARNRVNTAFMVATFCGQLVGTSAGDHLYARGGWIASGSYSVGSIGVGLIFCFARGPWEEGWVGWHGGWSIKKKNRSSGDGKRQEKQMYVKEEDASPGPGDGRDEEKGPHEQEAVNSTEAIDSTLIEGAEDGEIELQRDKEDAEEREREVRDEKTHHKHNDGVPHSWPTTTAAPQ